MEWHDLQEGELGKLLELAGCTPSTLKIANTEDRARSEKMAMTICSRF